MHLVLTSQNVDLNLRLYGWLRPPRSSSKNQDNNKKVITSSKSLFFTSVIAPLTKRISSSSILSHSNKNSTFSENCGDLGGGVYVNNISNGIPRSAPEDKNWFQLESMASSNTTNYSGAKR